MALADTGQALGKVSQLLSERLNDRTGLTVTIGRPQAAASNDSTARLNLFLYEALFDPSLRNTALDNGQPPPLWLVLKYLLTAFDDDGNSDTIEAHEALGEGLRALQELSFLRLTPPLPTGITPALQDNPELLKITFDETPVDLLSQLMQGPDEQYRFSMGFQVRPVLIAPAEPPSYSLLVGVDYTVAPPETIGESGVQIPVLPSLGPTIGAVVPEAFETGDVLTITGTDLHLSGLSVRLGDVELAITAQRPDRVQCRVEDGIAGGEVISAGSHGLAVVQTVATGRRRSSNLLVGRLLPTLTAATPDGLALNADGNVFGNIDLEGVLLGTDEDDAFVALYRDGEVTRLFDVLTGPPGPPTTPQTRRRLEIPTESAVPPGDYLVILRVGGQQARRSPVVHMVP